METNLRKALTDTERSLLLEYLEKTSTEIYTLLSEPEK